MPDFLLRLKIKKQITYIEHILAQNTHYYFSRVEWRYTVEILEESKVEIQKEKLQMLYFYVCYLWASFQGLRWFCPSPISLLNIVHFL